MTLIIEIALGIVLAVIILEALPLLIGIALIALAVIAVVALVFFSASHLGTAIPFAAVAVLILAGPWIHRRVPKNGQMRSNVWARLILASAVSAITGIVAFAAISEILASGEIAIVELIVASIVVLVLVRGAALLWGEYAKARRKALSEISKSDGNAEVVGKPTFGGRRFL
jgi:hypothetical protein